MCPFKECSEHLKTVLKKWKVLIYSEMRTFFSFTAVEILTVSVNTCKHVTITFSLLNEMMYTVKVNILNFVN